MEKTVLLIGSGGRESALAWKLAQSPLLKKLYIAPGNAGTFEYGENVAIEATDIEKLLAFAQEKNINLTVVGPENPLDLGIVDLFQKNDRAIFGPTKAASQIESSKVFSKNLMDEAGVPTAIFKTFSALEGARAYVQDHEFPLVIKDSGLVFGKGVTICKTQDEAEAILKEIFEHENKEVVIEEFLTGPEISIHAICAGIDFVLFPGVQDHKTIGEGDTGKMTGGIGAVYPLPFVDDVLLKIIAEQVLRPILETMKKRGTPFSGLLYPGMMLTKSGIKVLEFNSRFGDPECALYMRLLESDILPALDASAKGDVKGITLEWKKGAGVNLVLCSGGYPDEYKKGLPISGIEEAEEIQEVVVFHAGTKIDKNMDMPRPYLTNGGRVLGISALGDSLEEALSRAYVAADKIHFEGKYYRRDIGAKVLRRV